MSTSMASRVGKWTPVSRNEERLDWIFRKIQALPYKVTMRYAFYRVMQEFGGEKGGYGWFKDLLSKARKSFYKEWRPWTLPDDNREITSHGAGYDSPEEWVNSLLDTRCILDKYAAQDEIVLVAFEAEAMHRQFEYYTRPYYVDLIPFKGDFGIDAKWKLAEYIKDLQTWYPGKFIRILYFGDFDTKGRKIPRSAFRDVKIWAEMQGVPDEAWTWEWVGLTMAHVQKYNLPDNPDKPGEYQWESLDDPDAKEIITGALDQFVDRTTNEKIEQAQEKITERWKQAAKDFIDSLDLDERED